MRADIGRILTNVHLSGREVFSAMYTPRRKMMLPYFAAAAAKLYEVILTC